MSTATKLPLEEAFQGFLERLSVRDPEKLLFINIPQVPVDIFSPETAIRNGYHNYQPVGYLYLAAAARMAMPDIGLSILDLNHEMLRRCHTGELDGEFRGFWKDLIAQEIRRSSQLFVCVGNMFEATSPVYCEILEFIRASFPQVPLLAGGVQTTIDYQKLLDRDYCHLAFRFEAETSFQNFLKACGARERSIPGSIAFRYDDVLYESPPNPGVEKEILDIRPYYYLIDVADYHKYGGVNPYSRYVGKEKAFGTVLINRGCRAACTFCGVRDFNGKGVRRRTLESVLDEIKYLVEEKGISVIEWLDDDLLFNKKATVELFKAMAEELPDDFEWIANNGIIAAAADREVMYWMVKSGCKAFKVGIESGNDAMLAKVKKPGTKKGFRRAGEIFNEYPEVFVSGNYMIGFPGETFGEIMDTYNFSEELSWDWANWSICQPHPGTDIFDAFQSLGDDRREKEHFGVYNPGKAAAQKGNFGYHKGYHSSDEKARGILSGKEVFNIPRDQVPSEEQIKEIWFTFNLVVNFLNNRNFKPGGNPDKIVRWFESIHASYPMDASMCACLAYGYQMLDDRSNNAYYRDKFHELVDEFDYWKRRVEEFPELLDFVSSKSR